MSFDEWEKSVPVTIRGDALWKLDAYRLALFASDFAWIDVTIRLLLAMVPDQRGISIRESVAPYGIGLTTEIPLA